MDETKRYFETDPEEDKRSGWDKRNVPMSPVWEKRSGWDEEPVESDDKRAPDEKEKEQLFMNMLQLLSSNQKRSVAKRFIR